MFLPCSYSSVQILLIFKYNSVFLFQNSKKKKKKKETIESTDLFITPHLYSPPFLFWFLVTYKRTVSYLRLGLMHTSLIWLILCCIKHFEIFVELFWCFVQFHVNDNVLLIVNYMKIIYIKHSLLFHDSPFFN